MIIDLTAYINRFIEANGVRGTAYILETSPAAVCHWKQGKTKPNMSIMQKLIEKGYLTVEESKNIIDNEVDS